MEMEFAIILSGDLTSLARGWMTRAEFLGRLRIHKEMMQNNHRMSAANCARVDDSQFLAEAAAWWAVKAWVGRRGDDLCLQLRRPTTAP